MKNRNKVIVFCVVCVMCIGCDRITKNLAVQNLKGREPLSYFHNAFILQYAENTGAFLSFGDNWPVAVSFWLLTILPLLFLLGLFAYVIVKSGEFSVSNMLPIALLFSGGIGNIIDRVWSDRHVVDFMNLGIAHLRTGIFNLADVYVTVGILLLLLMNHRKRKQRPA